MGKFFDIFLRRKTRETDDAEGLRTQFKERYHQFKLLLAANNRALDIMAEMEEALRGVTPFGMQFVRSRCISASTNVFQITKHINSLGQGKYEALLHRFKAIQEEINALLQGAPEFQEGPLVLELSEVDRTMADRVGSKVANLAELANGLHLKAPDGFALTSRAYHDFMAANDLQTEIDRRIQATDARRLDELYTLSADLQQLIIRAPLPEDLRNAILDQYEALVLREGKRVTVAMRSSALGEDLAQSSFAGQYRSQLNVSPENLAEAYKEIIASKYGLTAMTYRLHRGIRDEDAAMCVACMSMVDAVSSGVAYSRNPVDIRDDAVVINAVWGLPKSVVDGSTPVDLFVISRHEPMAVLKKEIARKEQKYVCYPDEGVCRMDFLDESGADPSLSDEQARELARLAVRVENYCGGPQDIEWAVSKDGSIVLLQCRPLRQRQVLRESEPQGGPREERESVILRGGTTASPGAAAGPVFVIRKDMDVLRFPQGSVMVTAQGLPRWATVLGRASAVVTERGSIAGHLANVAREYGVPALFGVAGALASLKNGQDVTVDADRLVIYEGRVEALLQSQRRPAKNLMAGSPIYETLREAASRIVPLNLLDPDSPAFKAENCRTLHDITRFCHEKAVAEMFRFGRDHHFPERSSKQLVCNVPMKWWILNLDDGFREEVDGKYVQLDNIVSIPMLALWEGITARPWEGPPPVDGKGFMSVMFRATTNTALDPGVRSSYGERNYFMISRHFCSLTSRLGFHFSTVETLVGDRPSENYISFHFKGGAADDRRKILRVLFIQEILEEYQFRVEVKEDTLMARMEDHERPFMEERLKILGYLTIHTRQLDMIMRQRASVNHYRAKIMKGLQEMLASHQKTEESRAAD